MKLTHDFRFGIDKGKLFNDYLLYPFFIFFWVGIYTTYTYITFLRIYVSTHGP